MKKKIVITMLTMTLALTSLTGCGSAATEDAAEDTTTETTDATEDGGEDTEIANPWVDSDQAGVLSATGFDMAAPEGATNVYYSYMTDGSMADMTYSLDGSTWTYRMATADALTDISGLYIDWTAEIDDTVAGLAAKSYSYVDENDIATNMMIQWYDAVTGVCYSLSAYSSTDLDGMDIQVYAENIYQPLQGESTDDAAADAENELNTYFLGDFTSSYDGSTLSIADNSDGTYSVNVSIYRLADLSDGVGTFKDHKMYFEVKDPNENPMQGVIYRDNENNLEIKITDSTWDLISVDETFGDFAK